LHHQLGNPNHPVALTDLIETTRDFVRHRLDIDPDWPCQTYKKLGVAQKPQFIHYTIAPVGWALPLASY